MKLLKSLVFFVALILAGCAEESSLINNPGIPSSNETPNWIQLPTDISKGLSIETLYSASKLIKGNKGGDVKLNINIRRPGHQFGDFKVKAKVKVKKHSFPDNEERLFTITLDTENAFLYITPSPHTLDKHVEVDFEIQGIDVSGINPETFDFVYVADNNEVSETSKDEIEIDYNRHKIKVKKAKIHPTHPHNTRPGSRYGWIRNHM